MEVKTSREVLRERNKNARETMNSAGIEKMWGEQKRNVGNKNHFKKATNKRLTPSAKADETLVGKIINGITKFSIYLTVFCLPLIFGSNVPSALELNKQVFLIVVVGIGFLAWVGKMAWKNEIRFRNGFILIPVAVLILIMGLSTIFSAYTEQSLWGYFGGEGESFITLLFLVAFFILVFNLVRDLQEAIKLIFVFLISGFLATLFGLLKIIGINPLPFAIAKTPFFNTIGSVYIFSVYVGALFLMSLSLFLSQVPKVLKIILILLSTFFFFVVLSINFALVSKVLVICLIILLSVIIVRGDKEEGQSKVLPMIFLVLLSLVILRGQTFIKIANNLPAEIGLKHKTSASIAFQAFKSDALLGNGPATYVQVYRMHRPSNVGRFWSVDFNSPSSYFFNLMSTTGILGTLAFLFLIITGLFYFFRSLIQTISIKSQGVREFSSVGAGVLWLFLTIVMFLYSANITILAFWWFSFALFLSFSAIGQRNENEKQDFVTTSATPRSSLILSFVFVLVIIGFVAAIYLQTQKYLAAVSFNQALSLDAKKSDINTVKEKLGKAVALDPNRDIYYRNLAVALFAQANKRVAEKKGDLSAEDSAFVSNMIQGALQSANFARNLSSKDSVNHVALAQIYEGVLVTMEEADKNAIKAYEEAIKYDPFNPALYQRLANIYVTLADIDTAKNQKQDKKAELSEEAKKYLALAKDKINKAIEIKPDFADGHLLMVSIYEREGDIDKAIEKEKENKKLFKNNLGMYLRLGLLYYRQEMFSEAEEEFRGALKIDNKYANALYFLGLTLDKENKKDEALTQMKKVLELNPDNEEVKKVVANLESGKGALEGLIKNQGAVPEKQQSAGEQEPGINPNVENQEIPKEATPSPEEVNQNKPQGDIQSGEQNANQNQDNASQDGAVEEQPQP